MKQLYIIICTLLFSLCLHAEEKNNERVYVHLDKDCYMAGENILLKYYVTDVSFRPSNLSRVGYIEICDTEKPHIQYKVAIENGKGSGKIEIPHTVPTGIYQLTAYTRYMRNEGDNVFFKRNVAIINMNQEIKSERIELIESSKTLYTIKERKPDVTVHTDKKRYTRRDQVSLSIQNLPSDVSDLVISVVRNDSVSNIPQTNNASWKEQISNMPDNIFSGKWLPEYEGHIITGQVISTSNSNRSSREDDSLLSSSISFVGKDIRLLFGQIDKANATVSYITEGIHGIQDAVTSILSNHLPTDDYRVDIVSPFADILPLELPALKINSENKQLIDRFIGVQLNQAMATDSLNKQFPLGSLYNFKPVASYDLDEYTRFSTVRQTIIEFVLRIVVRKVGGEYRLRVFLENENRFNRGNTLVLLDGIPLYDHNYILDYNPYLIKRIDIYDNKYTFGGEIFDCIASFTTHRGDLPSIQLGNDSQLFVYQCPDLPVAFSGMPDYSDMQVKESIRPDFRHTLYWEPFAEYTVEEAKPVTFYTSDLTGEFKVIIEGITKQGNMIYGSTSFKVDE